MSDRDKIAEIIREARINASPMSQLGYPEADALIKHGAILLPCKVGDMLYIISDRGGGKEIYDMKCDVIHMFSHDIVVETKLLWHLRDKEFGETVFLTREEAEKKLEELSNGKI